MRYNETGLFSETSAVRCRVALYAFSVYLSFLGETFCSRVSGDMALKRRVFFQNNY